MPPKVFQCDFCDSKHRKLDLAQHIKVKHKVELARHLVEDAKQSNINVIASYQRKADPKMMPIPSRIHADTDYWFGVKPVMMEEKDSAAPYLAMDVNVEAHAEFIKELMSIVSLNDLMEIHRANYLRSPECLALKDKVKALEETIEALNHGFEKQLEQMRLELDASQKTLLELNGGILHTDLHIQIERAEQAQRFAESYSARLEEQVESLKWKVKNLEKRYDEALQSNSESSGMRQIEMEEAYLARIDKLSKDKATLVAQLEKEKAKNSKYKAKKAKTDRESQKRKELKERLKREEEELKARKKALKKLALSDSESDDDSSASSCDDD